MPSSTAINWGLSPRCPAVSSIDIGFWPCSHARCSLVVSPPRERPSAWSACPTCSGVVIGAGLPHPRHRRPWAEPESRRWLTAVMAWPSLCRALLEGEDDAFVDAAAFQLAVGLGGLLD